jgi:hypothetical protein
MLNLLWLLLILKLAPHHQHQVSYTPRQILHFPLNVKILRPFVCLCSHFVAIPIFTGLFSTYSVGWDLRHTCWTDISSHFLSRAGIFAMLSLDCFELRDCSSSTTTMATAAAAAATAGTAATVVVVTSVMKATSTRVSMTAAMTVMTTTTMVTTTLKTQQRCWAQTQTTIN